MKLHPKSLLFLPVLLLAAGCASDDKEVPHPLGRAVTRTPGDAAMYTVKDDDMQLERANRHARKHRGRVHHGPAAVRSQTSGISRSRKLFITPDGKAEHIWLADVKFTGNRFVGIVDNKPANIPKLKIGDRASVNPDEISDWSYVDHNKLVGGYTIRVLYAEMSARRKTGLREAYRVSHRTLITLQNSPTLNLTSMKNHFSIDGRSVPWRCPGPGQRRLRG